MLYKHSDAVIGVSGVVVASSWWDSKAGEEGLRNVRRMATFLNWTLDRGMDVTGLSLCAKGREYP